MALVIIDLGKFRSLIFKHDKLRKIPEMRTILGDLGHDKNDYIDGIREMIVLDIISSDNKVCHIVFSFESDTELICTAKLEFNYCSNTEDYSFNSLKKYKSQELSVDSQADSYNDEEVKLYNDGSSFSEIKEYDLKEVTGLLNKIYLQNIYFINDLEFYYLGEDKVTLVNLKNKEIVNYKPTMGKFKSTIQKLISNASKINPDNYDQSKFNFVRSIVSLNKFSILRSI